MTTLAPEFIHPSHQIHDALPSGFSWANVLQVREYEATGSVNGAAKVCAVRAGGGATFLAIRNRPPRALNDIVSTLGRLSVQPRAELLVTRAQQDWARDEYIRQYNNGYSAGRRGNSTLWDSGMSGHAWDDGYLDGAAQRAKWHLTYCADHDECGEA